MKVVISTGGRFHAFNLAAELAHHGYLEKLITSYPAFAAARFGVPREKVASVLLMQLLSRGWRQLPRQFFNKRNPDHLLSEYFDRRAAALIPNDVDIFVGWSSYSLRCLRRAKELGAVTVLDHGSSHIEYQRDILNEEYARYGMPGMRSASAGAVAKELQEYAEADYVALSSRFAVRSFVERGVPASKLLRVPYGVDLLRFHPPIATSTQSGEGKFRVIYVGGMTLRKGVHYLLQAWSELNLPPEKTELLLVGGMNPEIKPFFEKYSGHYKYVSSVPQSELVKYYNQSSVFVLDSIEDGFGMVIIQAMACGLPVIASENTGGPDIVRDGTDGFIIPIRDAQKLKERIKYLYENPEERKKMGASAMQRVQTGFTWADYGNSMIGEYERILHNR